MLTFKRCTVVPSAVVAAALLVAAVGCSSADDVRANASRLKFGMTPSEVETVMGTPTVREALTKDGKQVEYWSYFAEHRLLRHYNTYECVTFTDGKLTEWIEDYGNGGHSNHRRR